MSKDKKVKVTRYNLDLLKTVEAKKRREEAGKRAEIMRRILEGMGERKPRPVIFMDTTV